MSQDVCLIVRYIRVWAVLISTLENSKFLNGGDRVYITHLYISTIPHRIPGI